MDVLILASAHDLHAHVVEQALRRRGVTVGHWDLASFGDGRTGSIRSVDGAFTLELEVDVMHLQGWPRTVWARRLSFPRPVATSHEGDRKHIRQENSFFFQSAWWLSERRAQIEDELPRLEAERDVLRIGMLSRDEVLDEAKDLAGKWPDLPWERRRQIVETITDRIVIGKEGVEITLLQMPSGKGDALATEPRRF